MFTHIYFALTYFPGEYFTPIGGMIDLNSFKPLITFIIDKDSRDLKVDSGLRELKVGNPNVR